MEENIKLSNRIANQMPFIYYLFLYFISINISYYDNMCNLLVFLVTQYHWSIALHSILKLILIFIIFNNIKSINLFKIYKLFFCWLRLSFSKFSIFCLDIKLSQLKLNNISSTTVHSWILFRASFQTVQSIQSRHLINHNYNL